MTDLSSQRLRLIVPFDAAYRQLYEARYQPEVMALADDDPHHPTLTEYLAMRRDRACDSTCFERIIFIDDAPAGTITAFHMSPVTKACELGIVLVSAAHWGLGFGPEAIRQFFALLHLRGMRRVVLETLESNTRAQKAFQKVGFRETRRYVDPFSRQRLVAMQCTTLLQAPAHPPGKSE